MKWTRHQFAPAVPVQQVIDRAVAGCVTNCSLVRRLKIVDVQHLPRTRRFGKTREQGVFFGQCHVFVFAPTIRFGLERFDPTVVMDHMRAVYRAQRHAHRCRNRRLRHPTFTPPSGGKFFGDRWQEWNGKFRDDVRRLVKGDNNSVPGLACRILGSPDLYGHEEREAEQSINFVTCHDGFTLNDLVSYNQKHNEDNGHDNRDGTDDNLSWNCSAEGPTNDPAIEALRNRQIKNFLALTLLSAGTPMLLMGDEMRRTQLGNNNAYCHDSELTWLD